MTRTRWPAPPVAWRRSSTWSCSLGGTLSGEHGVGLEKRDFVARELDATALRLMADIKRCFDPAGILNPGKTLPPEAALGAQLS